MSLPSNHSVDLSSDVGRARYFRYHVEQGGFAQLLFNLGGEHLQEFAEMLERAGATVAGRFYERALRACLDDEEAYQAFLSGDFIGESTLKSTLQRLSLDYVRVGPSFEREAAAWLVRAGASRGLLVGMRAAHSGSSTTYAHLGEVHDEWRTTGSDFLEARLTNPPSAASPSRPLQASLRRQGRGAGSLGVRFTPEPTGSEIVVRVAVGTSRAVGVYDTLGLDRLEGQAVLDGIVAQAGGIPFVELGPGRLDVLWATSHPVDGSASGFRRLAGSLVPLLFLPVDADENDVASAWRRQDESVRIARMGPWLAAALAGHPERGAFRAGASDAELDRLERSLGVVLPDPVRWMLRQVDGGSWVDDRPPKGEDEPEASCACGDLLSTEEIRTEFFDLGARARLRRPDGSMRPTPGLPIARMREGQKILAVELSGAGRVLEVRHEVDPTQWPMAYPRYADFIEDFMWRGGCIEAFVR